MAGNRKAAEAFILKNIDAIIPGSPNKDFMASFFASMNDKEFDTWIDKLDKGEVSLTIQVPNLAKYSLSLERNFALAKQLGHEFYQRIWIKDTSGVRYLTPNKYMVLSLPVRRQAQFLEKKISIPENNKSIDTLTGQPTGASKGAKISYPEAQIMAALNLDQCTIELMKFRGGDLDGFNAMNAMINRTGVASMETLHKLNTTVESTNTLRSILHAMHLRTTL